MFKIIAKIFTLIQLCDGAFSLSHNFALIKSLKLSL